MSNYYNVLYLESEDIVSLILAYAVLCIYQLWVILASIIMYFAQWESMKFPQLLNESAEKSPIAAGVILSWT